MILLGIDPSLNSTGYGVIKLEGSKLLYVSSGIIKAGKEDELENKLLNISNIISEIIKEFKPQKIGIEETFVNVNFQSSLKLGMVRGALILTCANAGIKINHISPNLIKKCVTGQGKATKEQVSFMIKRLISGIPPEKVFKTEDETDALAVAITTHFNKEY
jgi:crossover junction endodeoxyribonuclease RuvC